MFGSLDPRWTPELTDRSLGLQKDPQKITGPLPAGDLREFSRQISRFRAYGLGFRVLSFPKGASSLASRSCCWQSKATLPVHSAPVRTVMLFPKGSRTQLFGP